MLNMDLRIVPHVIIDKLSTKQSIIEAISNVKPRRFTVLSPLW